jgi:lipooligosaccharide transport system ATP-binding protein
MSTIISAVGLTKEYNGLLAVDHINFEIRKNECFGFLGPNGAGKTTTMRMLQNASPKTSGSLLVKNIEIENQPRQIKKVLGVVPQENNLDPDFTVLKNLLVYARYFDIPKKIAETKALQLLKFVKLYDKKDVIIEKLSGGMKRRLILARALLNDPEILILDEPTTGLDPQARHLMWEKIKNLQKQGVTIIITTHYMEEAFQLCNRLVIMDLGKIIVEGNPSELVQKYIGSQVIEIDKTKKALQCILNSGNQYEEFGDQIHAFTSKPEELTTKLIKKCNLTNITIRQATLEDVFLKLTGKILRD